MLKVSKQWLTWDVRLILSLEAVHMVQALPGSGSHKHLTWSQRLRITAE